MSSRLQAAMAAGDAFHAARSKASAGMIVLAIVAIAGLCAHAPNAASAEGEAKSGAASPAPAPAARKKSPYRPEGVPRSGREFIAATKGVADMKVRRTNGGNLIRFSYRVVNAEQAKALNDSKAKPYLVGHTSHAMLQVPVVDKVGPLRQSSTTEPGREYWVMFSNKGDVVKTGERVSVVIGSFRVDGLRVE
jgi:hypothetical protein